MLEPGVKQFAATDPPGPVFGERLGQTIDFVKNQPSRRCESKSIMAMGLPLLPAKSCD